MSAHMDQLIAQFESFQAKLRQAEARFAGVGDMQERIAQVETTVTLPDGNVTVVAGAGGTVADLRLAPGAVRLGSDRLSEVIMTVIMTTLREAQARRPHALTVSFRTRTMTWPDGSSFRFPPHGRTEEQHLRKFLEPLETIHWNGRPV